MDELDKGATAEVEVNQEQSMEDTIRETLNKLESASDDTPTEPIEPQEEKPQSNRDVNGRFSKREEQTDAATELTEAPEAAPKSAPNTWKKDAQEAFLKADPILQAEIERREADFHKGIEQYKNAAAFGSNIDQAIAPYKSTLQRLGVAPEVAISELMKADSTLRHGTQEQKELYAAQLFQSYGIDLNNVLQRLQNTDPRLFQEQQRANYYEQQLQQYQQNYQRQEEDRLNSEILTFAADPKHSHFQDVRAHMAALIQAGQASTLEDAYEQAVYANPTTRAAVLQQKEAEIKADLAKKAQMAKQASSVNMRSRPSLPTEKPIGTMEDSIREKARELGVAGF